MAGERIIAPLARLSFPEVFEMGEYEGKKAYSTGLVFGPEQKDALKPLKRAALQALKEKFGAKIAKGKFKSLEDTHGKYNVLVVAKADGGGTFRLPWIDDPDTIEAKGFEPGSTFLRAKTVNQPQIVSIYKDPETGRPIPVTDQTEVYGGRNAMASLDVHAYDKGHDGVTFMLGNLQVHPGGEPFGGGGVDAADEFEATEDASELGELEALDGVDSEIDLPDEEEVPEEDDGEDLADLIG